MPAFIADILQKNSMALWNPTAFFTEGNREGGRISNFIGTIYTWNTYPRAMSAGSKRGLPFYKCVDAIKHRIPK